MFFLPFKYSSAAALVSEYLNTVEAKQRLLENSGYLRLMVIETSAGIYSLHHFFSVLLNI